jgi:hypothetical protein
VDRSLNFPLELFRPAAEHQRVGWLFLKGLALVYIAAFLSLAVQIDGLAGPGGILPFHPMLDRAFEEDGYIAVLRHPTLFWLSGSDATLQGAALAGAGLALLLLLGWGRPRPVLILLYVLYLSLYHAGQIFTSFQWDTLLLECGFLSIFLADGPTRLVVLLYYWLLFRLRFLSGYYKLASGDPSWRDFSALKFYFETQPLPHVGAWYAHQLAPWLLKAGVGFTFFAELIVPFFIFLPRPLRVVAAGTTILAQLLIIATSNHNSINLLTILLCLFVLDDRIVARMLPARIRDRRADRPCTDRPGLSSAVPSGVAAVLIMAVSLCVLIEAQSHRPLPRLLDAVAEIAPAFGIGNLYHLFPTMQTERQELQIGGSYDGVTWQAYEFRYKPDDLKKAPPFVVPHQPRLDWMMWFLPPQWGDTGYWFPHFLDALRQNKPAVTRLLARNPFEGRAPPNLLRVEVFRYQFTTPLERARSGDWWKAEYLGRFPDVPPRRP